MRRWFLGAALALPLAVAATADDPPKKGDPPAKKEDAPKTPADELKTLQKEVNDANAEVSKALRDRKDEKDKEANAAVNKAIEAWRKKQVENAVKALELAKKDPKSELAAEAVAWAVQGLRGKPDRVKEALALVREHHLASPKIRPLVGMVSYLGLPEETATEFLTAIAEASPDKATKATALIGLAGRYKSKAEPYGRPAPKDADQWRAKAEDLYERVVKEFGDIKYRGDTTFADQARGELFELRNLGIGKVAPEIEGEDLDGVKFKLSDYRGKVVVIDFWGDW